jgi:hypothetical protein
MAFDAEVAVVEQVVKYFRTASRDHQHMTIRPDSTSAIAPAGHGLVLPKVLQSHFTPQYHRQDGREGRGRRPVPDRANADPEQEGPPLTP